MYTKREAAQKLGIDRKTLDKWLKALHIEAGKDGRDDRLRVLSEEDVRTIRERYADRHTFSASFTQRPPIVPASSSDLAARVAALEATIEQLRERAPYLFGASSAGNLAVDSAQHVYPPPRRLTASTASHTRTPARPPVPPHLMSTPTWARRHDVNPSTVKTWREKGKLPVERGQWLEDGVRIDTVLTAEGREVAHQLAHLPWPCERCMVAEEETEENEA